jgi:hypothetical protein
MAVLVRKVENSSDNPGKAVKKPLPSRQWPVYSKYKVQVGEEGGESYVVACTSMAEFVANETDEHGQRVKAYRGRDPGQDASYYAPLRDSRPAVHNNYAPLMVPELVVELANRADNPITPEVVLDWAETYGLLASSREDDVLEDEVLGAITISGHACRESVSAFARAAGEVRMCLRVYEALGRDEELDLEELPSEIGPLSATDKDLDRYKNELARLIRPWKREPGHERAWLFDVLGTVIQARLHEHCYPQFNIYTRGGYPTGRFVLSWGFYNLLGAIWLQIAGMLENENSARFCRLPDCRRVITLETGEPSYEISMPGRGTYKTRSDRVFCRDRPCKQKYHYRKKAGWPNYP